MDKIGFSGKIWKIGGRKDLSDHKQIIDFLLKKRGLLSLKEKKEFLSPQPPSSLSFSDFGLDKKSVSDALKVLGKNLGKKIVIYGDYDADGITSTAVLWEALYSRGFDTLPYLPDRAKEGYGIKAESVFDLKRKYPDLSLVITVDNGIVAVDEIKKIKAAGISVIVVDHHQKGEKIPPADAIVHTTKAAGVGVAWFLSQAIRKEFPVSNSFYDNSGLELAAIGTVADQVSLIGPNRSLVKYGIDCLRQTKRKGLLELFKEAGIAKEKVGTYEINFIVSPRINAVGRISHALESLQLLCTKDRERAEKLALHLGRVNKERQKLLDDFFLDAKSKVLKKGLNRKTILVASKDYAEGIVGLVASKLVEEFHRPAIAISLKEGVSKGSCRSITGFNITEALRKIGDDFFDTLGGHPMAAGFSISTGKIKKLESKIERYAQKKLHDDLLRPKIEVDLEISAGAIGKDLVAKLSDFEPLGVGNPAPLFYSRSMKLIDVKKIGKNGEHLKLFVYSEKNTFEAVAFNMGSFFEKLKVGQDVDLVYNLEINNWNGNSTIYLKVKDLAESGRKAE